jgi:O-antigen ligase
MGIAKKVNFSGIFIQTFRRKPRVFSAWLFIFLFLALFPLGQIIRIGILHPIDVVVGLGALWAILYRFKKPKMFNQLRAFLLFAAFSWIFSVSLFPQTEVLYGLLYLVRLFAYFYFFVYVWNFLRKKQTNSDLLVNSLLGISVFSALFGWIQFFMIPDLKPFFTWGWDEHLFRLAGTFLDPTFLGLIIVFGLLISINRLIDTKRKDFFALSIFLIISLAFTYSRAGYLAFFAGLAVVAYCRSLFSKFIFLLIGFMLLILLLPTSQNNVLKFSRSFSALARIENYNETFQIFKTSPVFGVGYNNICLAKGKSLGIPDFNSHACSGSDSSILFILTTTGVAGLIVFVYSFYLILERITVRILSQNRNKQSTGVVFIACVAAILTHSLFSHSLFYPWVLGYFIILLAVVLRGEGED